MLNLVVYICHGYFGYVAVKAKEQQVKSDIGSFPSGITAWVKRSKTTAKAGRTERKGYVAGIGSPRSQCVKGCQFLFKAK